jgi:hypothetical protein
MSDRAVWERVEAQVLRPGDVFATKRQVAAALVLVDVQGVGESSRWLVYRPAAGSDARTSRIRPRHTKLFWRLAS